MRHVLVFVVSLVMGASVQQAWAAPQIVPVSVATDGTAANGPSRNAVFSGNGRFIAFASPATNLVSGDTNGTYDVFVRDLVAHTTERVSVTATGAQVTGDSGIVTNPSLDDSAAISLSADGTFVAFVSRAAFDGTKTNQCTVGTSTIACSDIYVKNRTTGAIERVSVASDGSQGDGESVDPHLSADGRYVVFSSTATNLVSGDHNGLLDVFLHDRLTHTTTRLSVSPTGNDLSFASSSPRISGDGQIVAFVSQSSIVPTPDPLACPARTTGCARAFILDRSTGTISRVPLGASLALPGIPTDGAYVNALALTPDARYVAVALANLPIGGIDPQQPGTLVVYDRVTGRVEASTFTNAPTATISDNGRYVTADGWRHFPSGQIAPATRIDRVAGLPVSLPAPYDGTAGAEGVAGGQFSPDGLSVLITAGNVGSFIPDNTVALILRDGDGDGIPDDWETLFGLNPNDPADAALDADGDGLTNLQEYQNGTHPTATFKRYFAEGAANDFFVTGFSVFNPTDHVASVVLEFLGQNGRTKSKTLQLQPHRRGDVAMSTNAFAVPDNSFSTIIEADQPVVADRTMYWGQTRYGSSAETAIEAPSTTWYLAEGSTGGSFDLFYLLQNPNTTTANVTVSYLRPAPAAPIAKSYTLAPKSRRTIYVDTEGPELAATDVSAKITSDQPILAERSMYFSTPTQPFAAGHEGAAVAAPAMSWFFAEGATGSFFDLFLLVANAETTDADVQVTYLLPSGAPVVKHYTVAAQSRVTINVDVEDPKLHDTAVSMIVESTNNVPVIAERAMWWPSPDWYEAHLSAGATTTGTKWALAAGGVSTNVGYEEETYILIANTSSTDGTADVTLYFGDGTSATKTFPIAANSRTNVRVSIEFPQTTTGYGSFATIIQSGGPPIVVERAIYDNVAGQIWAAGSDALGTKLQE